MGRLSQDYGELTLYIALSPPFAHFHLCVAHSKNPLCYDMKLNRLVYQGGISLNSRINSQPGNPYNIAQSSHAVLTLGYREQNHPANRVYQRVVEFLEEQFEKSP